MGKTLSSEENDACVHRPNPCCLRTCDAPARECMLLLRWPSRLSRSLKIILHFPGLQLLRRQEPSQLWLRRGIADRGERWREARAYAHGGGGHGRVPQALRRLQGRALWRRQRQVLLGMPRPKHGGASRLMAVDGALVFSDLLATALRLCDGDWL